MPKDNIAVLMGAIVFNFSIEIIKVKSLLCY